MAIWQGWVRKVMIYILLMCTISAYTMGSFLIAMALRDWKALEPLWMATMNDNGALLWGALYVSGPAVLIWFVLWGFRDLIGRPLDR